jgi:glutamine amidotransferase
MLGIIDAPSSNARALLNSYLRLGIDAKLISTGKAIDNAIGIIIPGVGNFKSLASDLESNGIRNAILCNYKKGKKILGVCLGMQILGNTSEESSSTQGLELLNFSTHKLNHNDFRIPHIGWNNVYTNKEHPVTKNLSKDFMAYFANSYGIFENHSSTIGYYNLQDRMAAIVGSDNVIGFQFHPEKSQKIGLKLLSNFAEWCHES